MRCAAAKEVRTGEKSVIEGGIQRWLPTLLATDGAQARLPSSSYNGRAKKGNFHWEIEGRGMPHGI
jgi:hypothetical protein